jgi:BASS family bile acid:Na+ symporter
VFALAQIVAPVLSMVLFVAVGLDMRAGDFARFRLQPLLIGAGVVAPVFVLPPIAMVLSGSAGVSDAVRVGLLLIAISPIGGFSTIYSYIANASPALSVTLTMFSALIAPLTIPLLGAAMDLESHSGGLAAPMSSIINYVLTAVLAPVAAGMWIRTIRPEWATRYRPLLSRLSVAGVVVLTVAIIADDVTAFGLAWREAGVVVTIYCLACFAAGAAVGMLVTRDPRDRFSIATEFTARNAGVALALALNVLARIDLARYAILYIVLEAPVLLLAAAVFRRYFLPPSAAGETPRAMPVTNG